MTKRKPQFFRVDVAQWARVSDLGLHAQQAYLGLSMGRKADTAETEWGVRAIEKYFRLSRARADAALHRLQIEGLVEPVAKEDAILWARYPVHRIVESGTRRFGWLPHSVVLGVEGDRIAPVRLLAESGDPLLLRLFVELYAYQDLPGMGGLPSRILHDAWDKQVVLRTPLWQVAAFTPSGSRETGLSALEPLTIPHLISPESKKANSKWEGWWERLHQLIQAGLLVPTLRVFASDDVDADTTLSFCPSSWAPGHDAEPETTIGATAEQTARAMLEEHHDAWNVARQFIETEPSVVFLPLPPHMIERATLRTCYRLRYRAQTSETEAWWGQLQREAAEWRTRFQDVAGRWEQPFQVATAGA